MAFSDAISFAKKLPTVDGISIIHVPAQIQAFQDMSSLLYACSIIIGLSSSQQPCFNFLVAFIISENSYSAIEDFAFEFHWG